MNLSENVKAKLAGDKELLTWLEKAEPDQTYYLFATISFDNRFEDNRDGITSELNHAGISIGFNIHPSAPSAQMSQCLSATQLMNLLNNGNVRNIEARGLESSLSGASAGPVSKKDKLDPKLRECFDSKAAYQGLVTVFFERPKTIEELQNLKAKINEALDEAGIEKYQIKSTNGFVTLWNPFKQQIDALLANDFVTSILEVSKETELAVTYDESQPLYPDTKVKDVSNTEQPKEPNKGQNLDG